MRVKKFRRERSLVFQHKSDVKCNSVNATVGSQLTEVIGIETDWDPVLRGVGIYRNIWLPVRFFEGLLKVVHFAYENVC